MLYPSFVRCWLRHIPKYMPPLYLATVLWMDTACTGRPVNESHSSPSTLTNRGSYYSGQCFSRDVAYSLVTNTFRGLVTLNCIDDQPLTTAFEIQPRFHCAAVRGLYITSLSTLAGPLHTEVEGSVHISYTMYYHH